MLKLTEAASMREVLITHGATALTLILSIAHSHAKLLVNWFIAPYFFKKNVK